MPTSSHQEPLAGVNELAARMNASVRTVCGLSLSRWELLSLAPRAEMALAEPLPKWSLWADLEKGEKCPLRFEHTIALTRGANLAGRCQDLIPLQAPTPDGRRAGAHEDSLEAVHRLLPTEHTTQK